MSYPAIAARRMPFDIDGTEVGYRAQVGAAATVFNNGISSWLNATSKSNLNKENREQSWSYADGTGTTSACFWFFFPEVREITHLAIVQPSSTGGNGGAVREMVIQGSDDSGNGVDGTWETGVFTFPGEDTRSDYWRNKIFTVSFSKPMKVIRVALRSGIYMTFHGIHVYGHKAAGQTPDDIIICDINGNEKTSLKDWGDSPEGTTAYDVFYLKNVSSKQANGVNIQLNHADFMISTDQATWQAVIDITSLSAGQISAPIYVRRLLNPPPLTLGPKAGRAIVTVATFT